MKELSQKNPSDWEREGDAKRGGEEKKIILAYEVILKAYKFINAVPLEDKFLIVIYVNYTSRTILVLVTDKKGHVSWGWRLI